MRQINVPCVRLVGDKRTEFYQKETIYNIQELAYTGKLFHCQDFKKRDYKGGYINYMQIPCAFDIETTNIEDDIWTYRDTDVYEYLRKIKIRYDDNLKRDFPDFEYMRRGYFNQIHLYKSKGSYVDVVYQELNEYRPDLFPADIIAPADQLTKILDVYDANRPLKKGEFRPFAFMYHWQFCFEDQVVFGRTWKEFQELLRALEVNLNLSLKNRIVVFCHNLSFEWQFMRRFVDYEEGFFTERYKPLKIVLKSGIEFRCSQMLSNMSLAKFCENEKGVIHYKLSGDDYDYTKLRTPTTPMTEYEEGYCYNDVRGLCECIQSRFSEYNIAHIPFTSTGYVRMDARNAMRTNFKNRVQFKDMALNAFLYQMCRDAFRGGDTHANRKYVNKTLKNIQSFDITSSYPASMMMDKYPVTCFRRITLQTFYNLNFDEDCVLMEIMLIKPKYKGDCEIPYIPLSKCTHISDKRIEDNGRILKAEWLTIVCTEIDYQIIMNEYDCEVSYNEDKLYAAKKGYLPQELRDVVMQYYRKKTKLKDVQGSEYEYSRAKGMLNAIYGMSVMRIDQSEIEYTDGKYIDDYDEYLQKIMQQYEDLEYEEYNKVKDEEEMKKLEETLQKFYKSRNNFMSYQWGVWVTANSRKRLREMLNVVGKDVRYVDTDSIKCAGDHRKDFEEINEKIKQEAIKAGAYAKNKDGQTFYLGTWDYEGLYLRFKTLGAKKYLVEMMVKNKETGEMEKKILSTIAGVNKKKGAKYFTENGFEHFCIGEEIKDSGHMCAYYNDDEIHEVIIDGERFESGSNIALINDSYTIGITDSFEYVLAHIRDNIEDIDYM